MCAAVFQAVPGNRVAGDSVRSRATVTWRRPVRGRAGLLAVGSRVLWWR
ncbi:hypothetical protein ACFTZI_01725 [Streptomyces decoyicus]